jgi:hypothetical protein
MRRCVCAHERARHLHYRPGTDCGCGCMGFRWRWLHLRAWRNVTRVRREFL